MKLSNDVVVVTGAAAGVGRALACEAAKRGARVVVADIEDASATASLINAAGGVAIACLCDVTDTDQLQTLVATTREHYGQINMICANAGSSFGAGTLEKVAVEDMRRTFELSVVSVLATIQAFLPALKESGNHGNTAEILITGSEHALSAPTTSPPLLSYTAAKHALVGLAACARRDLAGTGVSVHLLCPGWVRTERLLGFAEQNAGLAQTLVKLGQNPDEVAQLAFDGITKANLVIPTNPASRGDGIFAHAEILDAVTSLPAA